MVILELPIIASPPSPLHHLLGDPPPPSYCLASSPPVPRWLDFLSPGTVGAGCWEAESHKGDCFIKEVGQIWGREFLVGCTVISPESWSTENRANKQKEANRPRGDGERSLIGCSLPSSGTHASQLSWAVLQIMQVALLLKKWENLTSFSQCE